VDIPAHVTSVFKFRAQIFKLGGGKCSCSSSYLPASFGKVLGSKQLPLPASRRKVVLRSRERDGQVIGPPIPIHVHRIFRSTKSRSNCGVKMKALCLEGRAYLSPKEDGTMNFLNMSRYTAAITMRSAKSEGPDTFRFD